MLSESSQSAHVDNLVSAHAKDAARLMRMGVSLTSSKATLSNFMPPSHDIVHLNNFTKLDLGKRSNAILWKFLSTLTTGNALQEAKHSIDATSICYQLDKFKLTPARELTCCFRLRTSKWKSGMK